MLRETPLIPLLILQKIISGVFSPLTRFYILYRNKKSFMPQTQPCRPCFLTDMEESYS